MQNVIARSILVIIASAACSAAFAGPTAELKVVGLIKPVACTPVIGSAAIIDYGTVAAGSLVSGQNLVLATREVSFAINCDAKIQMAVTAIDNKASTKVSGLGAKVSATAGENSMFGLGSAAGKNTGAFHFSMKQGSFTGDGVAVDTIGSATSSTPTWSKSTSGGMSTDRMLSWSPSGTIAPGKYQTIAGTLAVTAVLNKPENLTLTQEITLDGSATIELKYL